MQTELLRQYFAILSALPTCDKLDSMRWFSHRHSLSPPGGHAMVSSVAACCVRAYGARLAMHCQWTMTRQFFDFSLMTLTFDLDIRTRARFIMLTRQVSSSYV